MEREVIFSLLAFIFTLLSSVAMWQGIFRWHIITHPFTFFIWIIVVWISSIELIKAGEFLGSFSLIIIVLNCIGAFAVGLYFWKRLQISWMDWFFLFSGIFLIVFWVLAPEYKYTVLVMIAIDATAYASTFKKAYLQPFTEQALPYFIALGGNISTILAISLWNFENLGMWIWTATINFVFACFVLERQYHTKK